MKSFLCPKCGSDEYFFSKRNIVQGTGWLQKGSIKSVPVCRVCDEMMMVLHGENNLVNKIGKYGLISIGVILGLSILVNVIESILN